MVMNKKKHTYDPVNVYDVVFCNDSLRLKAVNCFRKKTSS